MKTLLIFVLSVFLSSICYSQTEYSGSIGSGNANTSYSVGNLPGSFGVSPSGGATYMIPLDLPAGRVDMKPDIAFYYNSQQKAVNILGQGWSLTGFSVISRSNPTIYYNGSNDNIDFIDDELMLDGQHLIKVKDNEYRTELDVFSKIEMSEGPHGKFFIVHTKNGLIMEYGNTSDSRQVYSGNNSDNIPLAWHLNKTEDRLGNSINYTYIQDQQHGDLHPISILYTGYKTKDLGSTKVAFIYLSSSIDEKLQHKSYFEKNGQEYLNSNSWLLEKIQISNDDGSKPIKDYVISYYQQQGVSKEFFLKDITLYNYNENGIATPIMPTTFLWEFYQPVYQLTDSKSQMIKYNSTYKTIGLDVNGDHFDEIAAYFTETDDINWDNHKIIRIYGINTGVVDLDVTGNFNNFYPVDWDNNGDDELLVVYDTGIKIYDYNSSNGTLNEVFSNSLTGQIYTGDITGDAINDIFIKQTSALLVLVGKRNPNGTFGYDLSGYTLPLSINQSIRTVADINGDGNVEILCKGSANNSFSLWSFSAGSGFFNIANFNITGWPTQTTPDVYYEDFNGDGKTDMCYLESENGSLIRKTFFSFGNNFTGKFTSDVPFQDTPSIVADINNDGRADFVYVDLSLGQFIVKCYFTSPDGISSELQQTSVDYYNTDYTNAKISTANINANGTLGFILTMDKSMYDPAPPHHYYGMLSIQTFADMGIGNNVIRTIVDGYGMQTKVNYSNFGTSGPLYANFPIAKPRFRDNVVSESYTVSDNTEKWNWNLYTYNTPLIHLQGKGFLGYKGTQVISKQNNLLTISENEVLVKSNKYFYPYPATRSTWSMNNGTQDKLLSETTNIVDLKLAATGVLNYLPVVIKSVTKSWDNDAAHSYKGIIIENQSLSDIDNYGNVNKHITLKDETEVLPDPVNKCSWEQTIETWFLPPDVVHWFISLPETLTITTFHKPEESNIDPTYTTKVDYRYFFPYGNTIPLLEHTANLPDNDQNFSTENWYLYDQFGNITKKTIKAKIDGTSVERITEFGYSADNGYDSRFLTSKTLKAETIVNDQVTTFTYDPVSGRLLTSSDLNEVGTTTYVYDDQGNLKKTILPDETSNEIILNWSSLLTEIVPPPNALYYTLSFKNLKTGTYKWHKSFTFYDKYSRPLRTVTQGLNGVYINTDNKFDNMGRIWQVSEPYFATGSPSLWTTTEYDNLGRIIKQTLPTGAIINTMLTGLTTKVTNTATGIWKETTVNILGKDEIVKDPTGGTINYNYDAASRTRSISALGVATYFEYDAAGNRTKVIDPDAGITVSKYNALGELVRQTDARGSTVGNTYDQLGRIKTSNFASDLTLNVYNYNGKSENGFGQIKNIIKTYIGGKDQLKDTRIEYVYDELGRLTSKTEKIDGFSCIFGYDYNVNSGMLEYYTYPSLYRIKYSYDPFGHMNNVTENSTSKVLWYAAAANERGQLTDYTLGNNVFTTHKSFNSYGFPRGITTKNNATQLNLQDHIYDFNIFTGNLNWKSQQIGIGYFLTETYGYDPILKSRLTSWQVQGGSPIYTATYNDIGNIITKSGITQATESKYTYADNAGPHAVTGITLPTDEYLSATKDQTILYNGLNKVSQISQYDEASECVNKLNIEYGPDNQRIKSVLVDVYGDPFDHSITVTRKTKYFFGDFEIEIDNATGQTRQLNYISGGDGLFAIMETKNEITTPYYIHTDYLGNYNLITSGTGEKLETLSFDPWGRRRHPNNWSYSNVPTTFLFDRGYTGHEHLDKFNLINMNGRVYDPFLARFLSPDPYLENSGNSQANNRYSYCLNNPLIYTDPSGYKPIFDPVDPSSWTIWNPGGGPGGGWMGGGGITPISGHHWSNGINGGEYSNFMLMSSSSFVNLYGSEKYNQLYFNNITIRNYPVIDDFTLSGSNLENFFSYLQAGFSLYNINAFGRTTYVMSLGDIGQLSLSNGGIKFSNQTAGELLSEPNIITSGAGDVLGGRDWVDNTQIGLESYGLANSSKSQLIKLAAKFDGSINDLKYVKGVKVLGKVTIVGSAALTGYQTFNDIQNGNYYSALTRATVLGVGLSATAIPFVGWFVAGGIGLSDAIWGDQFYNWVELKLR